MRNELAPTAGEGNYDIQQKWKKLGDLALQQCNLKLAEECMKQALDLSGLLLLYSSNGSASGIKEVAALAEKHGKTNIAFLAYFVQGEVEAAINLLISTNRIPEAAFLARTYLPSKVPEIVVQWKAELLKVSTYFSHNTSVSHTILMFLIQHLCFSHNTYVSHTILMFLTQLFCFPHNTSVSCTTLFCFSHNSSVSHTILLFLT